jgi:tricorn protease-like protein
MAIALTLLPALVVAEEKPDIDQLIKNLGHDDFDVRTEARTKLEKIGEPALEKLRKARTHDDVEIRDSATYLVTRIEKSLRGEISHFGQPSQYWLNRVVFSPDGTQAIATGGAVIWYDLATGREVNRVMELNFARAGFSLSTDGKTFATGHQYDNVVRIGAVDTGKEVKSFAGHTGGVYAVAFSPDGKTIVSGGLDRTLRLWDVGSGREVRQFAGVRDQIRSACFSPDGKRVASGHWGPGSEFQVRLWDVDTGKELKSFGAHRADVTATLFTPDGKQLLSTGMDGAIILWDVEKGKEVRRMTHQGGVYNAAMSPDGKRVLTAGYGDRMVRLWELSTGKELRRLDGHTGAVLGVAFSPDGKRALSCDSRTTLYLWKMPD